MNPRVSRRRLLAICATGAMGALAGCADPDVAMFVDRLSTDQAIAERAVSQPEPGGADASLVANATANGTEAANDGPAEGPPFEPDRPVVYNGTVYDLHWESTGRTTPQTEYVVSLTAHADGRETDIEFAELPTVDREQIEAFAQRIERYAAENQDGEQSPPETRFTQQYTAAEQADSVLVPEPEYDAIGINGYPVTVDIQSKRVVEQDSYRYTATERASTLAAFGRALRDRHGFELTGLNETEREFFETVIADNGSYYQGGFGDEYEDAFAGVADRLVEEPALFVVDRKGEWLVGYDGTDYWVTVDFVRMAEYADRLERVDSL